MSVLIQSVRDFLGTVLFSVGENPVTVGSLGTGLLLLIGTVLLSGWVRRTVDRVLTHRGGTPGVVGTASSLVYYILLIAGFGVALSSIGIDLAALFAAGALFAVGLGFAMQNIAQNFVAGVILIAERTIKPGDLLEVEGKIVKVLEMGIRASIEQTRDGEDLIVPNAVLIQTSIKNYTLRDKALRVRVQVGVSYRSDMALVKQTLTEIADRMSARWSEGDKRAQVLMNDFGDSSVSWEVGVWIDDPWEWRPATSEIRETIWWAFLEKDITIAFPQLDVHLDTDVVGHLATAAGRAA